MVRSLGVLIFRVNRVLHLSLESALLWRQTVCMTERAGWYGLSSVPLYDMTLCLPHITCMCSSTLHAVISKRLIEGQSTTMKIVSSSITLQPLYNMFRYNTVLDITWFKDGSQKCIDYIGHFSI